MTMDRLVDGVYQLGSMANSYIVDGDGGVTLVDMGNRVGVIAESLTQIGRSLDDVTAILLTHSHIDHTTSAAAVKRASGATVYASEIETPAIEGVVRPSMPPSPWFVRPMFWISVLFPRPTPTVVDTFVSEDRNELLPGDLRAIDTPGHTPGHTSYLLDRAGGLLLVGDAAVATRDGRVKRGYSNRPTPEIDGSLRHMAELDFEVAAFGHSAPIRHQASAAFRAFAERIGPSKRLSPR